MKIIILSLIMIFSGINQAISSPAEKLEKIIHKELSDWTDGPFDENPMETENKGLVPFPASSFSGFEIVAYANAGINVPFLANLTIGPEIEIIWIKTDE